MKNITKIPMPLVVMIYSSLLLFTSVIEYVATTTYPVSRLARNTANPMIKYVNAFASVEPNPKKEPIRLNYGDPTIAGNLLPAEAVVQALHVAIDEHRFDGYGASVGFPEARQAVAAHYSTPEAPFTADDVIMASGCSHALELAIVALADPGDNILVPAPGYPKFTMLSVPHGIENRFYQLQMDNGGLIDLNQLESLIDMRTRAIIVNNPSNPTGVVFPADHLEALLEIARRHNVPIIADEIYSGMVFNGATFYSLAALEPRVPVIVCDGMAKRFLVPGWRLGWAIVHDQDGKLADVKRGMVALSQKISGPSSLIQGALPAILRNTPSSHLEHVNSVLAENAHIAFDTLNRVPGLKPLMPQGSMYMVIEVDPVLYGEGGDDELAFIRGLIAEESVYCMPGAALYLPGWFRLVLTYPPAVTREACERIAHYCQRRLMTTATNSIISLKLLSGEEEDRRRSLPMMEEVKRSTKTTMINGEELGDDGLLSAEDRDFESGPRSRFAAEEEIPKVFFSRERGG